MSEMILCRAPMRVSLLGGGTDYPEYFHGSRGFVVGTAIDAHVWRFQDVAGEVTAGRSLNIPGLGSSSAAVICEVAAEAGYRVGYQDDPRPLVKEAHRRESLRRTVGMQDHVFAACGRYGAYEFSADGFWFHSLGLSAKRLQAHLLLLDTGVRSRHEDVREVAKVNGNRATLDKIRSCAEEGHRILCNLCDMRQFGRLVDLSWQLKKDLASTVSTAEIDDAYRESVKAGAHGGKLCGAGGAGCLALIVPPDKRAVVIAATGLTEVQIKLWQPGLSATRGGEA